MKKVGVIVCIVKVIEPLTQPYRLLTDPWGWVTFHSKTPPPPPPQSLLKTSNSTPWGYAMVWHIPNPKKLCGTVWCYAKQNR